jgi:DNA (cytosine-5)-methyltransferase 1
MPIPVIDLFAGPGGLGEGFSSLLNDTKERRFKIKLSIEMDAQAHQTLELRAFFREFPIGKAPDDYYQYLRGEKKREELFSKFPDEAKQATNEAWCAELGGKKTSGDEVRRRISTALVNEEKWVLIGGPPCQAYSLVGRSRRVNDPEFATDKKHFLYKEYLQILAEHKPPVFVMENVKGLLSATVKQERIFDRIYEDLAHPLAATGLGKKEDLKYEFFPLIPTLGELERIYRPEDFIIKAEDFGIPQARHRLIILGVRSDWPTKPGEVLKKSKTPVCIEDIIDDLPRLRSGLSKEQDSSELWQVAVRRVCDSKLLSSEKVSDALFRAIMSSSTRVGSGLDRGGRFLEVKLPHLEWFSDSKLEGVCNHETRSHIRADLHRYFYSAVFAREIGRSPALEDFPKPLLPKHKNVDDALKETKFNDRFRVQIKGRPSTTVVSHISKDGHYYIHYDPSQCRSLTVREAARLQTFPDNYFFEGPRTQQYHQVGNAVPPLLAKQIAEIVAGLFD